MKESVTHRRGSPAVSGFSERLSTGGSQTPPCAWRSAGRRTDISAAVPWGSGRRTTRGDHPRHVEFYNAIYSGTARPSALYWEVATGVADYDLFQPPAFLPPCGTTTGGRGPHWPGASPTS